jgi:hypothetical protein
MLPGLMSRHFGDPGWDKECLLIPGFFLNAPIEPRPKNIFMGVKPPPGLCSSVNSFIIHRFFTDHNFQSLVMLLEFPRVVLVTRLGTKTILRYS